MTRLHEVLARRVTAWRAERYPCVDYPAIAEILDFASEDGGASDLRYLRQAHFRALETYWYLRLVLDTPTIPRFYETLFPMLPERLAAMDVSAKLFEQADYDNRALSSGCAATSSPLTSMPPCFPSRPSRAVPRE